LQPVGGEALSTLAGGSCAVATKESLKPVEHGVCAMTAAR
jgi:hypothetical protein